MKKLFVLLAVTVCGSLAANAQTPIRYQGEVDAGYSVGTGDFSVDRVNIHLINGIAVGKYFSTGIGVGLDYYTQDGEDGEIIPLFLNLKGYLPVGERFRPFVSFDIGAGIGVGDTFSSYSGILYTPALGCAFRVGQNHNAVLVSVGYNVQKLSESGASLKMNAVSFKVGFQF